MGFIKRVIFAIIILCPYGFSAISAPKVVASTIFILAILFSLVKRWAFIIVGTLLVILGFLQLINTLYAGSLIDEYYWIAYVATNKSEAISFITTLTWRDVFLYVSYMAISIYLLYSINDFEKRFVLLGGILIVIFTIIMISLYGFGITRVREFVTLYPIYIIDSYLHANNNLNSLIVKKHVRVEVGEPLVDDIYLFLGESATKLRMSAYGYNKNTTPNLNDTSWERFDDYVANGLNTQPNLKTLFSGKVLGAKQLVEYDIIRAAQGAGYKVIYIDNNKYQNVDPLYVIAAQSDRYVSLNGPGSTSSKNDDRIRFDIEMDQYVEQAVSEPVRKLVIVHLAGSHPSQDKRYPPAFDKFNNAYDSSISYTDYLVGKWTDYIVEQSNNRSVAMLYVSDHGAKVPPGCGFGPVAPIDYHSYGADDRYYSGIAVPFFAKFNKSFRQDNKNIIEYLKLHRKDRLDHTTILPSLAQLMGYKYIDKYDFNRSIFSKNKHVAYSRLNTSQQNIDSLILHNDICVNK